VNMKKRNHILNILNNKIFNYKYVNQVTNKGKLFCK